MTTRTQTRHSACLRAAHAVLLLTALWLPGALAADDGVAKRGPSPAGNGPPAPKPIYVFDGPLVREMSFDRNEDGHPEYCAIYNRGALLRVDLDQDNDGVVEVRLKYDASRRTVYMAEIDGELRFVPLFLFQRSSTAWSWYGLVSAEKLVDGRWTGTFTYTESEYLGPGPDDGPVTQTAVCTFEDGKPVRWVRTGGWRTQYERIEFTDGLPATSFIGDSAERLWKRITWKDGKVRREEEDLDHNGTMDTRREYAQKTPNRIKIEKLVDGQWTGTFEETKRVTVNRQARVAVASYKDGYPTSVVTRRGDDGPIVAQETYRDGYKAASEHDSDADGTIDMKCRYKESDPYFPVETLKLENGRWMGDFVVETESTRTTYANGRMTRFEQGGDRDGDGRYDSLTVYFSDLERRSGTNGRIDTWMYYDENRQLQREDRDLDGDEKPDLFIDYVNLTIERRPSKPTDDKTPAS